MSTAGIVESGAQLLARLGPRPSLKGFGTALLGLEPSPGDIIELYGGEGVGKTELLLHLVKLALLPAPGQRGSYGNDAQAIWVDCDLKFSVLRLAVLLEQGIVERNAEHRTDIPGDDKMDSTDCDEVDGKGSSVGISNNKVAKREHQGVCQASCLGFGKADVCHRQSSSVQEGASVNLGRKRKAQESEDSGDHLQFHPESRLTSSRTDRAADKAETPSALQQEGPSQTEETACSSRGDEKRDTSESTTLRKSLSAEAALREQGQKTTVHSNVLHKEPTVKETSPSEPRQMPNIPEEIRRDEKVEADGMAEEEVEKRLQECLKRLQVVHCTSSQQLIATLCSLEDLVAANRNVVLLVIDSVSAFFWSDKVSDLSSTSSSSVLNSNMSHVASVVRRIAESYGVLVAVSKQALVKSGRGARDRPASAGAFSAGLDSPSGADNHVEFLGKAWSEIVTRRLVCSRHVQYMDGVGNASFSVSGSAGTRRYTICESGVCFDV